MSAVPVDDPVAELERILPDIERARTGHQLGQTLERALAAVVAATPDIDKLEILPDFAAEVRDALNSRSRAELIATLHGIRSIGERIAAAANPDELTEVQAILRNVVSHKIQSAEGAIRTAWRNKVDGHFASDAGLAAVLIGIAETRVIGQGLLGVAQRANALRARLDSPHAQAEELKSLVEERGDCYSALKDAGADEAIVEFLIAVANQEATLAQVSPAVIAWLEDHHTAAKFRVAMPSTTGA